jgi:hypothetical protein
MNGKRNRPAGGNGRAAATNTANVYQHSTTNRGACDYIPIRRGDGRIVGELRGDVLGKHAKREHMLRTPPAWAWDCSILDAAENAGARFTEIECDNGLIYRATLSDFRRYGFPVNRGYGAQRGLALTYWQIRRKGEPPAAVQMSLFGGAR